MVSKTLDMEDTNRNMTGNSDRLTEVSEEVGINWWWCGRGGRCSLPSGAMIWDEDGEWGMW